jgi:hypothetical protein
MHCYNERLKRVLVEYADFLSLNADGLVDSQCALIVTLKVLLWFNRQVLMLEWEGVWH